MRTEQDLLHQEKDINTLLDVVYQRSGYDFREYERRLLLRRIARHMGDERHSSVSDLRDDVDRSPEALERFINLLTVDVSSMFRDASFFRAFREKVAPLLRELPFIRIWHAGCAGGEEVYSMAILLEEEGLYDKSLIYATDMNADLLQKAKRGIFPLSSMQEFTRNYMEAGGLHPFSEYYSAVYNNAIFRFSLQKNILWARHNLTCDGKFHELNVVICRNVLIYFNADLQNRVHELFYNSLESNGILGLGSHETIRFTPHDGCYQPLDGSERIYRKVERLESM